MVGERLVDRPGAVLAQETASLELPPGRENPVFHTDGRAIRRSRAAQPVIAPIDPIEALLARSPNPPLYRPQAETETAGDTSVRASTTDRLDHFATLTFPSDFLFIRATWGDVFSPQTTDSNRLTPK